MSANFSMSVSSSSNGENFQRSFDSSTGTPAEFQSMMNDMNGMGGRMSVGGMGNMYSRGAMGGMGGMSGGMSNMGSMEDFLNSIMSQGGGSPSMGGGCGGNGGGSGSPMGGTNKIVSPQPQMPMPNMSPVAPTGQPSTQGISSDGALSSIPRSASVFNNGPARYDNVDLTLDADGTLSEASKKEVSELLSGLSAALGGRETFAAVFENNQGGLSLELTAGDTKRVSFRVPDNLIYSAHTHPNGSTQPSAIDRSNQLQGEEAVVVDGQSYTYAQRFLKQVPHILGARFVE